MKVVVGLGNPGEKYAGTRHNVGFDVLDELSKRFAADRWQKRFEARVTEIRIGDGKVLLVAPQTYMNLSGRSVRTIVGFYKLAIKDLLLICDDMNLPLGRLRLKGSGSAGGQNGLKNTIQQLGTDEFARLRFGVDRPPEGVDAVQHVLQTFAKSEQETVQSALDRAANAVECWVNDGIDSAMNQFNQDAERQT